MFATTMSYPNLSALMDTSAFLFYFLLLSVPFFLSSLAATLRTNITTDQLALLALKAHITDDPHQILARNWSANISVCNWIGVTCNANHHRVTALNLSDLNLAGTIPPHLGNLSFLSSLSLTDNNFHGSLPHQLASLRRLTIIYIEGNNLNGQIPSWFELLPKLQKLILSENLFTGTIPPSLCNISSLQTINLSYNKLSGEIPPKIGNLPNLRNLILSATNIRGSIPYTIFNNSMIEDIALSRNQLSGQLPATMGHRNPNLKVLYLWDNNLDGKVPSSISNASKLIEIDFSENHFSGSIPYTLGNLRHLKYLNLRSNVLSKDSIVGELIFLSSLTSCRNLEALLLSYNPLNGTLPTAIGNFSVSLTKFAASECNIKGKIPNQIGSLGNLIDLRLGGNELFGHIPSMVGGIKMLQRLSLQHNRLQGSIPNQVCHLRYLVELDLSGNELHGPIPDCWDSLSSLRNLSLGANHLTSTIPSSFWSLNYILKVNLSFNSLSGHLPLDIGNLKVLTHLDLSWNQFSGGIPSTVGSLQDLESLSLANNKFLGPIPESFGQSISMQVLDLCCNNLSGVIPKSLETLKYLEQLNVSFNRLQGPIPLEGTFANLSALSFMGNEALCGPSRLQVPLCKAVRRSKKPTSIILAYVLPMVIVTILVPVLIYFFIKYPKKKAKLPSQGASTLATWRRISYLELEQATNGFSSSNFLGKGSCGNVYKGILSGGMNVAVKVFNLDLDGSLERFDSECDVLCSIRHRNLVKIITCCSNIDFKALVLEYMSNGSFTRWLYSPNYSLNTIQRMDIMIDVALALEYLHDHHPIPIVHGDLKPNNILLDEDMVAHVSDFSNSKVLGEQASMTQTMTLASIGYMAPEYGSQGILSPSSDVYSFGILLMETFTRKKPTDEMFAGEINLKCWVTESLPHAVDEVIDANLLRKDEEHFVDKQDCILSIMQLAIACTTDALKERMKMSDVVTTLKKINMKFLKDVKRA